MSKRNTNYRLIQNMMTENKYYVCIVRVHNFYIGSFICINVNCHMICTGVPPPYCYNLLVHYKNCYFKQSN